MEPSKEAIAVRITRLNRQILGKVTSGINKISKRTIDREALLDALTVLYDECNEDPVKKSDELVKAFVDKYRSTLAELRRTRVCLSDFDMIQTIGRGHFGEVHMIREKETGDVYALKTLRKEEARKRAAGAAEDERDVLAIANSPWIPKLQYAFQDSSNLYLVMELCLGGDLAGFLSRRNHPLSERDAAFYVAEVAHALKALHGMGYVHRDVKPHNILLDRCGHVKLGDLGSCARLSEGGCGWAPVGTADYVAPEVLAAADCAARHTSACDYWSLGVVAFELVTLKRPFSSGDEDSVAQVLSNIQKYERDPECEPPFPPAPAGPSAEWRSLVGGLLRGPPRRYNYLDTLRHPALARADLHAIRDQAPPWVPHVRGAEDASHFSPPPRRPPPPSAAPFRARPPFAGQLPFIGYSYVAPDDNEESFNTGGFNASHDCTAIDLATYKSAEKLAAMRGREITSLQTKLAAAEAAADAAASASAERTRRDADAEAERQRARLQAEITALSLQNRRLERQVEVEKEERMALQRTNQELTSGIAERTNAESRVAAAAAAALQADRDALQEQLHRAERRLAELQAECSRAVAAADRAKDQHQHYKNILAHVQDLRHRKLTEINVRTIDTIAKERALRRQTLSGGEAESREAAARLASAEANFAREVRAREQLEKRAAELEAKNASLLTENTTLHSEYATLQAEVNRIKKELIVAKEAFGEKQLAVDTSSEQLMNAQQQLAQERVRVTSLIAQVQELQRGTDEFTKREAALEEQCARTEARLHERLEAAEARAAAALQDDTRHREKVGTLEQLVRRLEREVSALEGRACPRCAEGGGGPATDSQSDTESVGDLASAQLALLKEQLERAEAQLQARAEENATLRQEARAANLARWRKEREYGELSIEAKSTARELKRIEERLTCAIEARKEAEKKYTALQNEISTLRPQYERASKDAERTKERLEKLQKVHEVAKAEVDRSRNDIRKLKSELMYSEKRRLHAEEQEEQSSRERGHLRDELQQLRGRNDELLQNNKALQEACALLEEQLTDLEKLADHHELKNKDLEEESRRLREELQACGARLAAAERAAGESGEAAGRVARLHDDAREQARHALTQLQILTERLESRESRVAELEALVAELEGAGGAREAALSAALRRVRELQEESAELRSRAHQHHARSLQLQAALADAQEELAASREAAEAAATWWRTRETKADATLRQQAKLIDFLQTKVEEAGRKKCSLSNKLFGRSGRRMPASPPLRRANRELREEIERLRAKLNAGGDAECPFTPRREKLKPVANGLVFNEIVQLKLADDTREKLEAHCVDGVLQLQGDGRQLRAELRHLAAQNLPSHEADRAFTVEFEKSYRGGEAVVLCSSVAERALWVSRLSPPSPTTKYFGEVLGRLTHQPTTALYVAHNVVALGSVEGLHSLRGPVRLEWEGPPGARARAGGGGGPRAAGGGGALGAAALLALGSALRRGPLHPSLPVAPVCLPDDTPPHLLKGICGNSTEGPCAAVACGRRVVLLRLDRAADQFRVARSFTVDRPPFSLLLTERALYIAGEKPLRVELPAGALEAFAMDEPIIAAAARKRSPPRAILLVRDEPLELLICYAECGVFVDEKGKRTRNEDPKWSSAVHAWEFVHPFLYVVGEDRVTILYVNDDVYRSPPCTCDATSLASTASDCCSPQVYNLKLDEPALLGTTPNGIIVRSKVDDEYEVTVVEGMTAFRSIGASVESLETVSDAKGSSTDLARSLTDLCPQEVQDVSQESIEATTGFLADIRNRARQLRIKNRNEQSSDDVIKKILTTEVGLKRSSNGRKSPASISEFDSDSTENTEEERTESTKGTSDVCAEMFTRQVRFQ
ncbi:LOW QUALITY PROTEIN: uncharacterized protein ACR2FA_002045 [Aphomia sociella]